MMWKTQTRKLLLSLFLLVNSITWFSLTWIIIGDLTAGTSFYNILLVSVAYFGALIMSAIVGATLLYKNLRKKASLVFWVLLGVVTSVFSAVLASEISLLNLIFVGIALGASVGVGIPTCLSLFADQTKIENRGRIGAILFFVIQLLTFLLYIPLNGVSIEYKFLILAAWRLLGAVGILLVYKTPEKMSQECKTLLPSIIRERTFIFYFVPWFMFTLINFIEVPLLEQFFGSVLFSYYMWAEIIIVSFSGFIGGVLCDLKGRKVAGILGFILLGIGYGFLSLLPETQFFQILYVLFDGTAWGILYVTFIFVVWGDISGDKIREKYYLLGGMPFLLSGLIEVMVQPFVEVIPISTTFSLASFFLFLAILPLLFAPEPLPANKIRARELNNYIKKAQKEAEKAQEKEAENEQRENIDADVEFEVNQEDYEEALREAEKYY